jgi:V/A-type H+-transporting ATPase subunit E
MELNKICDQIINDATVEANGIMNRAKEKAVEIVNEETNKQTEIGETIKIKSKKTAQELFERMVSNANVTANKNVLIAKRGLIDIAFDKVLEKLNNLTEAEFRAFLKTKAKGITGKATFLFDKNLTNKVTDEFLKTLSPDFSLSKEHFENGFKIVQAGTELNFNFVEIIHRLKEENDTAVAHILFD